MVRNHRTPRSWGPRARREGRGRRRTGAATLDYFLVLAVILPMIAVVLRIAPRIMNLVYEMTSVLVSWPFV
jgi:hypothetical protein